MDQRVPLATGLTLDFPGMPCRIDAFCGRGSNAMVYRASYEDPVSRGMRHDVLIKELFPLHHGNAVRRDDENRLLVLPDGQETFALHQRSFEQGNKMHLELLRRHPESIGGNITTFSYNNTYYTLLPLDGGQEMGQRVLGEEKPDLRRIAQWMLGILEAVEVFHSSGFLHLDIAPDNIILIPRTGREDVLLIDYNSVYGIDAWHSGVEVISSMKDGFTAPEMQTGEFSLVSRATDLFSVTAVFFYALMGRPLEPQEITAAQVPDISESRALINVPDTVRSLAHRILRKGLSSLPKRRYQTAALMRQDFRELMDRIDCVGVTPWAILEKERARMNGRIRENPSMKYLTDASLQYPQRIRVGETVCGLREFLQNACGGQRAPLFLQAEGGMGKTTALQLCAIRQNTVYSPQEPVAVYLSAANYRQGQAWFIHDSILEALRFHPNTGSFENARHELELLLQTPLQTKGGRKPAVLILLDGLNEVTCDSTPLVREMEQLARMQGTALVVSSRNDTAPKGMQKARLMPLEETDVRDELARQGLLMPESEAVRQLLQTPLMLSMYVRSALDGGRQLNVDSTDELMECYLDAVGRKAALALPEENAPERWQLEAAIRYVLPTIAAAARNRPLSDTELLPRVSQCYRVIRSRAMLRSFPQWIGHRKEILGDAKTPEEWYGLMAHRLLWQRLGLLVREEDGRFRLVHQNVSEWLAGHFAPTQRKIALRRSGRAVLLFASLALLLTGGVFGIRTLTTKTPYDDRLVENIMDLSRSSYFNFGHLWHAMGSMVEAANGTAGAQFDRQYTIYREDSAAADTDTAYIENGRAKLEASGGEVVSYSQLPINAELFSALGLYPIERKAEYDQMSDYLRYAADMLGSPKERRRDEARDFIARCGEMLESDARLAVFLFDRVVQIHALKNSGLSDAEAKLWLDDPLESIRLNHEAGDTAMDDGSVKGTWERLKQDAEQKRTAVFGHTLVRNYHKEYGGMSK